MNRPDPRPTPFELDSALHALAQSVQPSLADDEVSSHVAARVRRQRRSRLVVGSTAAALVVAAGGVGLAAAWEPPRPLVPAPAVSPEPAPSPSAPPSHRAAFPAALTEDALACGAPAPTATGRELLATVSIEASEARAVQGELVEIAAHVDVDTASRVSVADPTGSIGYVLVQDGAIVSSFQPSPDGAAHTDLTEGSRIDVGLPVSAAVTCGSDTVEDPQPLSPGEYQLVAVAPWVIAAYELERDGTWGASVDAPDATAPLFDGVLVSEPVPFVVDADGEAGTDTPTPPDVAVPGAFDGPTTTFSRQLAFEALECGMPAPRPTGAEMLARLEGPSAVTLARGEQLGIPASMVGLTTARTMTADFRWARDYVIARDGVIVSSTTKATDGDGPLPLAAGERVELAYTVTAEESCWGGFPTGAELQPGEYTLFLLQPWGIHSYALQQKDGSWGAEQQIGSMERYVDWLVSEPISLTIS